MIDKKTIEVLIDKYKKRKSSASQTTDTDDDLIYALCEIFDDLIAELRVKSGLLSFEEFLQSYLGNTRVFKLSENSFEVVTNFGYLIDGAKTATYQIGGFQFIVKTSIACQTIATEYDLRRAVEAYNKIKE